MPVLAECNVENVCRSCRASNGLGKEQRANLSTPRLGHQTGRNQLLRREEEEGTGGVRRWRRRRRGGSFALTFMHHFFSHKKKFSYFKHLSRERETRCNVRQGVGWQRRVEVEQKRLRQKVMWVTMTAYAGGGRMDERRRMKSSTLRKCFPEMSSSVCSLFIIRRAVSFLPRN